MNAGDQARAVGDAVLYEGYLLYPYRASAGKNRVRWQWGVLVPPSYASAEIGEHASTRVECLLEPMAHTILRVKLRFLQAQTRLSPDTTWDEAVEHEIDFELPLADLPVETPFRVPGGEEREDALVRRRHELSGVLSARVDPLDGPFGGARLRLDLHNTTSWRSDGVREHALRHALLAAHLVLAVDTGHFLSMLDPPEWAKPAVEACRQERLWPVLIGDTARSTVLLASPIILYDNPSIAAESAGELFDGTEIDEILTLRTMTLTDEEKREARATDPRAAAIVDRVDTMPPELLDRLHGTVRYLRSVTGEPESETVTVGGVRVTAGSKVRLRPNLRGADAQDMFLAGLVATVRTVLSDVDGMTHVAVTLDDDPGADLQNTHGRFRYFSPDEIEPMEVAE
ncbi:hypothetical protein QRX60_09865 [Amycolatopsis mongoliensis]|uniref:Uncharacterized protein n=1 Tax=Amycolatopsis mongoliensis TaxID=715475 RepID=A0A9Y2JW98_9PSEU|nr:hypothetical protein [Amycolatopsis sp. 4-36]WIY04129.1 hypothetical protein QRX60_09865 [Amycolatopsis sp. 4-36]